MNPIPPDHGLIYTETNLHHFFPEPWNMVTSAFFLIPGFYWLFKLRGFSRKYTFLSIATWLLMIGCIGSTIYHGLRRWHIFIFMDWIPIGLLCLMASIYFWIEVTGKWFYALLALLAFFAAEIMIRTIFAGLDIQLMISLNYGVMVLMILLPLILLLIKMKGHYAGLVGMALFSFAVALFFRAADKQALLPMGTHFLWHIFGAVATSLMFIFIYRLKAVK